MELELGSPSVDRCGSGGCRRASDGGSDLAGGACVAECQGSVGDRWVDAHPSRDVGHHAVESGDCNGTAQFLKVSVSWIYEHVRPDAEDRLPVVKLGKYLRFHRRDLLVYIDSKRAASRRQPRRR